MLGKLFGVALAACIAAPLAVHQAEAQPRGGFQLPALLVESDAFEDGGIVPERHAARGENVQPGFTISNLPDSAETIAIIFHDLDVAIGGGTGDVLHWLAWNIPAGDIPEGSLPEGAVTGANITGQNTYMGPGAPPGPRYHHYVFEFYALDSELDLPETAGRDELLEAMQGNVVAKAAYVGRYRGAADE